MGLLVTTLSSATYERFISERECAVVHFDACWDVGGRPITRLVMQAAAREYSDRVNFGEVDCDNEPRLSGTIPIMNVPVVAYYRKGVLIGALMGVGQNVSERLRRVMLGETISYKDGSESATKPAIDREALEFERQKAIIESEAQRAVFKNLKQ